MLRFKTYVCYVSIVRNRIFSSSFSRCMWGRKKYVKILDIFAKNKSEICYGCKREFNKLIRFLLYYRSAKLLYRADNKKDSEKNNKLPQYFYAIASFDLYDFRVDLSIVCIICVYCRSGPLFAACTHRADFLKALLQRTIQFGNKSVHFEDTNQSVHLSYKTFFRNWLNKMVQEL